MKKIRFATIGTNFITERFIKVSKNVKGLISGAVYSRSKEKARNLADSFNVEKIYTDLNELANAQDIDAVYIASPNSLHYEQAILMLSHKKHVLCEKTIASNSAELAKMIETAQNNNVVLLEGVRNVFDEGFCAIQKNLNKLGKIKQVSLTYCQYSSRYDKFKEGIIENAFNPKLSNGALTDIGVYCIHALVKLFGEPKKIHADSIFLGNGVDGSGSILAEYDGMLANLVYSKISNSDLPSTIQGENGTMVIKEIVNPCEVEIVYNNDENETIFSKEPLINLIYEIEEWVRLIENKEVNNLHNKYSVLTLKVMDEARRQAGIVFPADKKY